MYLLKIEFHVHKNPELNPNNTRILHFGTFDDAKYFLDSFIEDLGITEVLKHSYHIGNAPAFELTTAYLTEKRLICKIEPTVKET